MVNLATSPFYCDATKSPWGWRFQSPKQFSPANQAAARASLSPNNYYYSGGLDEIIKIGDRK
jgi:hypothetical protein